MFVEKKKISKGLYCLFFIITIIFCFCFCLIMEEAIRYGLEKLNYEEIRDNQKRAVSGYLSGQDVFLCSPTGSGKSLVFEIAPYVFSYIYHKDTLPNLTSSVVVISPLVSLMRSQVLKLKSHGLSAVYLSDITGQKKTESVETLSINDIHEGHFDILLCSPESILGDHRTVITDLAERKVLRAIFIDEAHCITKL